MGIIQVAIDMLKDTDPENMPGDYGCSTETTSNPNDPFVIKTISEGFSYHNSDKKNNGEK